MSTAQLSRQTVVIPGRTDRVGLGQSRSRSTHPPALSVAYGTSGSGEGDSSDTALPNNRLDPIDKSKLSLSVLKQYNDLVGEDPGLTCRSLPPVKLSLKLSKTKFVDSPRGETSSRILKPLLTMRTHTAGHHVFTEGISKKSKLPNPAFALPKVGVPYSNLPDNVTIYKEKNKFAFGVRNETNRTPYRLTPKPPDIPGVQLHVTLPTDTPKAENAKERRHAALSDRTIPTNAQQLKSNKIVLDPIASLPGNESVTSGSNASSIGLVKEPLVPNNSFLGNESPKRKIVRRNSQADSGEGRLSIVSIGDTVTQNFFERHKQQTRKLYPMYDHKTRRDEYVKKAKFGGNFDYGSSKPEEPESTFTYKISSRSLELANSEPAGNVSPIKNNMRSRPPPVLSSSRGLGGFRRFARDGNEYDTEANYQDQKFRRLYRRMYYPPRSAGSNSSTDLSFLPANPPPSETSHIISEDIPQNLVDFKNEMITLFEEREKTASLFSAKLSTKRGTESSKDEDKTFVNADKVLNDSCLETGRSDGNETDTDIQMEAMMSKMVDERGFVKENVIPENPKTVEMVDKIQEVKEHQNQKHDFADKETKGKKDEKGETKEKSVGSKQPANNAPKQLLSVPTFSLDKLSHNPLGKNVREMTSLSRSIQNMALSPDVKPVKTDIVVDIEKELVDADKTQSAKECKVAVPVTKIRLFSESSIVSVETPRVSLTDEHGQKYDISHLDDTAKPGTSVAEKRLVANSNIHFISPLVNDNKAKRQ